MKYKIGQIIKIKSEKELEEYERLICLNKRIEEANLIAEIIEYIPAGYHKAIGDYYKIKYINKFPQNYNFWIDRFNEHDEIPEIIIKGLNSLQLDFDFS